MTVRDLIAELKQYPQDALVVSNYKEITDIDQVDSCYVLDDKRGDFYITGPAIILE